MSGAEEQAPRRRLVALADGAIAGLEWGAAARPLDILFLHANGFNAFTYRRALAPLGAGLRVLAIDMRGHGRSTLPARMPDDGWQVYARDVRALLAALGEAPRVLAGHSMGGATALLTLAGMRGVLPRLVLFDPVIPPRAAFADSPAPQWAFPLAQGAARRRAHFSGRDDAFAQYRGRGAFRTWPDGALRDYLEDGLAENADGGVALACAPAWEAANFAHFCMASPYAALDAPRTYIRILRGEAGSTCSLDRGSGPVRVETVPGTTHFLPMERPDLVAAAISDMCRAPA